MKPGVAILVSYGVQTGMQSILTICVIVVIQTPLCLITASMVYLQQPIYMILNE
jgi:hypothetical protein